MGPELGNMSVRGGLAGPPNDRPPPVDRLPGADPLALLGRAGCVLKVGFEFQAGNVPAAAALAGSAGPSAGSPADADAADEASAGGGSSLC